MHVYETVIKLSMVEHGVLSGISAVVAMLARGSGEVKKFESALGNLKLAAWGAAGAFAGFEMIKGVKVLADHAKELSHELTQIQKLGINPGQFAQASRAGLALPTQVPGMTSVDALKVYGQIYSPLGHENSLKMLKPLAEFVQVVGNTTGDYKAAENKVYNMVRAGDLMGKFMDSMTHQVDISKLQHFLDLGARVIQATHGRVGADQWFALAQQGGPALSNMTDQGLLTMAMITQAMGGGRAGTALSSLFTQFQGGIMTKWRAMKLMDLGLLDKKAIEDITPGGHIIWKKVLEPGTSPFARAMAKDPLEAIEILQRAMATHGYPTIEKQVPLLFELFQRQTSIREIHDLLRNLPQLKQERERIIAGLGISASANLQNTKDYEQVMHNATAAWNDMMAKIGLPVTIAAIPIMHKITEVFLKLGTLATVHPEAIEHIATGITILGAALISGGGIAIMSALGPAGWITSGLIALGIAVATYWDPINKCIHDFSDGIRYLGTSSFEKVVGLIKTFSEEIHNLAISSFEKVVGWIKTFGDAISELWGKIKSLNPFHILYEGGGFGGGVIRTSYGGAVSIGSAAAGPWSADAGGIGGNPILSAIAAATIGDAKTRQILRNIYGSESGHGAHYDSNTRGEDSWGPFQLNRHGGLGALFEKETGLSVRTQSTLGAQAKWIADYVRRHRGPLSQWRGLEHPERFGHTYGGYSASPPAHLPPPRQGTHVNVHHVMTLDGKVIATSVSKHFARAATYPTSVGLADGMGQFLGPGAERFA